MLMILDGFGINNNIKGNAIMQAKTPNLDRIFAKYPKTLIAASGLDVGLPQGQMGNSEVGHLNIGAGRIVYQDLTLITKEIKEIVGEGKVSGVKFMDDTTLDVNGVFIALGEAGGVDFAKKLGIYMEKDNIVVDENMRTNIPGIYACGNVVGGLLQINKAAYEGAKAGLDAVKYINEKR